MTLKGIKHQKASHHYYHKGPPFDKEHQLISADLIPVVKITSNDQTSFHYFFFAIFIEFKISFQNFFSVSLDFTSNILGFLTHKGHFWVFATSQSNFQLFYKSVKKYAKLKIQAFLAFFGKEMDQIAQHRENTNNFLNFLPF